MGLGIVMYLQENDYNMRDFHTHTGNCNGHLRYRTSGSMPKASDNRSCWGVIYLEFVKERELCGCPTFCNWS
jgi:hypothetical protein